jgi:protein-disulfide isomerase
MAKKYEDSFTHTLWEFLPGIIKALSVVAIVILLFLITTINTSKGDGYEYAKNFVRDYNVKIGKTDSNVKVVYFFDLQCPGCQKNDPILNEVREKYKDKVEFVYRNYPLSIHTFAKPAARGAQAVALQGTDKYFKYKDEVFANQTEISSDNIEKAATKAGVDMEKWKKDSSSTEIIRQVEWDLRDATSTMAPNESGKMESLSGTPATLLIKDGKIVEYFSSYPATKFGEKLDNLLK